jgi:hypothetical protein
MRHSPAFASAVLLGAAASALGQVDNVVTVVPASLTVGGVPVPSPIGAFGYDPINDRVYVAGFSNGDQELRRIDNVSAGAGTFQTQVFATPWLRFTRDENIGSFTGGSPTPGSILLNPRAIGLTPAYGVAWLTDGASVVQQGAGTLAVRFPEKTQRMYTYNLGVSVGTIASDVFTSQLTLAQFQAAAGQPATSTSTNVGRQAAFSGDGQSLYFTDTTSQFGGVWKIPAAGGAPVRLLHSNDELNTEPAVTTAGGVDTIYFRGGGTLTTNNIGGIDKITHDGTNTSSRAVHVPAATIDAFFEQASSDATIFSMAADADGNLYFNNTNTARRGVYKIDPDGRIAKVLGYEERRAAFNGTGLGNPNSNTLRIQPRSAAFGSGSSAFGLTQLLYAESNASNFAGANQIAGAYVFKTGDFDRDNDLDQDDIALFKDALALRGTRILNGTVAADQPLLKFDLNGNNEVTWKDVKVLQQFYAFFDGDADIDKTVGIGDFSVLAANFNLPGKKWTEGDFDGDEVVGIGDFSLLAANFNLVAPAHLPRGVVPEPTGLALLAVASAAALRRRR